MSVLVILSKENHVNVMLCSRTTKKMAADHWLRTDALNNMSACIYLSLYGISIGRHPSKRYLSTLRCLEYDGFALQNVNGFVSELQLRLVLGK